jgi:hypothetical protein
MSLGGQQIDREDEREDDRVARALQVPLPPARPAIDPSALWACGRHARRISTEEKISLVVTTAEIGALVGVLCVLVSFVDWPGLWRACVELLAMAPQPGSGAMVAVALLALVVGARVMRHRRT